MKQLYSNLIASLAAPIIDAHKNGNVELARTLLHKKITEHNSPTLASDLTRYIWHKLNQN